MLISIGTRSEPKVIAVCRAFSRYTGLWLKEGKGNLEFLAVPSTYRPPKPAESHKDPLSGVSRNPLTLSETIAGSVTRAKEAFGFAKETRGCCDYAVGLEAGLFVVEEVESKYLDVSICAIFDGVEVCLGGSPLFEYPKAVIERILAGEEAGLIVDFFGATAKGREGVIGPLTGGRVLRDEFEELAVVMALTRIVRKDLYSKKG